MLSDVRPEYTHDVHVRSTPTMPAFASFCEAEHRRRLEHIREAMGADGIDVCLCVAPEHLYWIAGYDSWVAVNSPQALVFTEGDDDPCLIVRDVDLPLAMETTWVRDIRTYRLHHDDAAAVMADLVHDKSHFGARIGIEMRSHCLSWNWGQLLAASLPASRFTDITPLIGALRWVKSPAEVVFMREAARHAEAGLAAMRQSLRPGISEIALAAEIEHAMRRQGCDYWAIPVELASGPRSEGGHATPRNRVIESGDLVHVELAGVHERYHAVAIATMAAGRPSAGKRDLYEVARRSLADGLASMRPGVPVAEVEEASLVAVRDAGLEDAAMMRFGYGIGIAYPPLWLETLEIGRHMDQRLQPGMTFVLHACLTPPGSGCGVVVGGTWLMLEDGVTMLAGSGAANLEIIG